MAEVAEQGPSHLDRLAKDVCMLIQWDKGKKFANRLCQEKLYMRATGLIGISPGETHKDFMHYSERTNSLKDSKFATIELSFFPGHKDFGKGGEAESQEEEVDLDIVN